MSWAEITLLVFGLIVVLLFMGVPVAAGLGLVAMFSAFFLLPAGGGIGYVPWNVSSSFVLTSIPLFVFMGEVFLYGGLSEQLYYGSSALVSRFPGGLLHSNIFSCAIFAAVSGSSVATAAAIGTIAIPELKKRGYDERMLLGSLAAGGTLGILIPPSIPLIIYGALVGEFVGALFMGGVFPGIMMALIFMAYIAFRAKINNKIAPRIEQMSIKESILRAINIWPVVVIIIMILGGIYRVITTPTEAAALGASVALVFTLAYRRMNWQKLWWSFLGAVRISTMVLFIIIAATMVAEILALLRVPADLAS